MTNSADNDEYTIAAHALDWRDRYHDQADINELWVKMWNSLDFSWSGLANAGWEQTGRVSTSQEIKRWSNGKTLQDYWRMVSSSDRLLTDDEMLELGLLVELDGVLWHKIHRPETIIDDLNHPLAQQLINKIAENSAVAANYPFDGIMLRGARARGIDNIIARRMNKTHFLYVSADFCEFEDFTCEHVKFGSNSSFRRALFNGNTLFRDSQFSGGATFRHAYFTGKCWFDGVQFEKVANFSEAVFCADASFSETIFGDGSSFWGISIGGKASFDRSKFGKLSKFFDADFSETCSFNSCLIGSETRFDGATFEQETSFQDCRFDSGVHFYGSKFMRDVDFSRSVFDGDIWFRSTVFSQRALFQAADFKGYAGFNCAIWPDQTIYHIGAFSGCRFRDIIDFKGSPFKYFGLLADAEIKGKILLDDWDGENFQFESSISEASGSENSDEILQGLSSGLRILKLSMASQGNREREHSFFSMEIRSRSRRLDIDPALKSLTFLYGITSNFGNSIVRPIITLIVMIIYFGAIGSAFARYQGVMADTSHADRLLEFMNLSLNNSIRPFSIIGEDPKLNGTPIQQLLSRGQGIRLIVNFISTIQSLASISLLFLFGLAIRRRYQIT